MVSMCSKCYLKQNFLPNEEKNVLWIDLRSGKFFTQKLCTTTDMCVFSFQFVVYALLKSLKKFLPGKVPCRDLCSLFDLVLLITFLFISYEKIQVQFISYITILRRYIRDAYHKSILRSRDHSSTVGSLDM